MLSCRRANLSWAAHWKRPSVRGLNFEMDMRGVRSEITL